MVSKLGLVWDFVQTINSTTTSLLIFKILTFKSNNLAGWIHDSGICTDGSPDRVGGVAHVNDNHLSGLPHLLSDTDVLVGLHGEGVESNVGRIDPDICELKIINEIKMISNIPSQSLLMPIPQ